MLTMFTVIFQFIRWVFEKFATGVLIVGLGLVAGGLWENSILLLTADNGGPIFGQSSGCAKCDGSAGANNWPLRGSKHSNCDY